MAFGAILGSLIVPALAGVFRTRTATSAALDASQTLYENSNNLDQISTLAERRVTEHRNAAFNARMTQDSEEAKESNMIQTFMVSVSGADKSVIEKLIQTVSS